uniref:CSON004141 protein n=1 Tax=Culicoides sonorensis TaxID=179676 RepID=A0A336LNC0_CULSO
MADLDDIFDCFDENQTEDKQVLGPIVTEDDENVNGKEFIPEVISEGTDLDDSVNKRKHDEAMNETEDETNKKLKVVESVLDDINLDGVASHIMTHTLLTPEACTHEVAIYPGQTLQPLLPPTGPPAKSYNFTLDPFQREAILCIENNQSVLVSAHTSAGKTVVAEYAIAKSLESKQRVIYTTPIKALSNQKYREFQEEFKDVGLITGDVTINPSASCLIMTTEILRNMLYRGSEIMRECGWVIFDEIHYMRDKERGVVWEETLILLPDNVHYVFLSATIPNARQFAEWVCHLHHQPCHVVYTDYRPTPLQHYLFPAGGDGIHLVVDEKGNFKEENFTKAMSVLQNAGEASKGDQKGRKGGLKGNNSGDTNIYKIIKMIMERKYAPVIIFSFSKKDCELYAMALKKLDFNTPEEKKMVDEIFNNAMDVLSEEDRQLPQVQNVLPLLRRGIGIHHGGLLPILKETIEILFGEGLLKALFATETFAMGLNMPARTVLYTSPRKFDGRDFRWLTSGEYIQMSGRAGRRGLDDKGIVILMIDEKVSTTAAKDIVQGKPDPINSAFHLTYNMVLNLLRVEEINPEYMLERSFFQFQNQSSIPEKYSKVQELQKQVEDFKIEDETTIASYHHIRDQLDILGKQFRQWITKPQYLIPFLQPGRLVKIQYEDQEFDWGMIVNFKKDTGDDKKNPLKAETKIYIDVLLHLDGKTDESDKLRPCPPGKRGEAEIIPCISSLVTKISSIRIHHSNDLRPKEQRIKIVKNIEEVKERFKTRNQTIPLLHPVNDMHIKEKEFKICIDRIEDFEKKLFAHPLHKSPKLDELYEQYLKKVKIENELKLAKQEFREAKSVLQMDELKYRKRVLRRLGYCTASDVIEFKGRVACELSAADELLLTEMIFNGTFNALSPQQCAALLSCFVCDEKSNESTSTAEELSGPLRQMQDLARRIAKVSRECKMELDEDSYLEKFKPSLMDVVLAWCKGSTFAELCKMTDIFEGSIIRCMRRLEELLRQMVQASKTIGNVDLENKFSDAGRLLKRDIVFAASLYL